MSGWVGGWVWKGEGGGARAVAVAREQRDSVSLNKQGLTLFKGHARHIGVHRGARLKHQLL